MSTVNELLNLSLKETANVLPGEIFLVKDLFKGYLRNRITRSDRLLLGTLFLNYVANNQVDVVPIEKISSGQQRYRKLLAFNDQTEQAENFKRSVEFDE